MARWYEGLLASFGTGATGADAERDRLVRAALVVQEAPGAAYLTRRWVVDPVVADPGMADPAAAPGPAAGDAACGGTSVGGAAVGAAAPGAASLGAASLGAASLGAASLGAASLGAASLGAASLGAASLGDMAAGTPAAVGDAAAGAGGRPPGPVTEEIALALASVAAMRVPLVVMDAPFGLTLLDRELRRHRGRPLTGYLSHVPLCVADPRVLDAHLDRHRGCRRSLGDLCAHYGPALADADDAAAGAVAALDLVREICRRYAERIGGWSAAQLHARQAVWHADQARGPGAWFTEHPLPDRRHPAWPLRPATAKAA